MTLHPNKHEKNTEKRKYSIFKAKSQTITSTSNITWAQGDIGIWLFEAGVGMEHPDMGPLYVVQLLALAIEFGYGG